GHLHHIPNDAQFAALGRLDVVMAAVDGGTTIALPDMISILTRLKSSVVIPMHWFSSYTLENFLGGIAGDFAIERLNRPDFEVSLRSLPARPTVVVLTPEYLIDP
ncbi:MBL fold metallo-hydrolase, partial [Pseudooceanicola sp.]